MTSDDLAKEMYEALKYARPQLQKWMWVASMHNEFDAYMAYERAGNVIKKYEQARTIPLEDEK